MEETHRYDSIIDLPHYQSSVRTHMSMNDRAAQFAPFATLTGHEAAIAETERLTDRYIEPTEEEKRELDAKASVLLRHLSSHPEVEITYFIPDKKKTGGQYQTIHGYLKQIDPHRGLWRMTDRTEIEIRWITDVQSPLFQDLERGDSMP